MKARKSRGLRAHLVGSVPLANNATVFRALAGALGANLARMPDGETGVRRSWIRFLQDVLAAHPGIEIAHDLPPFRFVQWDGKLVREIPRLRVAGETPLDPSGFATGYADMAIDSWRVFDALQAAGEILPHVKFQICMPTPIAPTYNNMLAADRPPVLAALTQHLVGEVERIAAALPHDRFALQWDVCQEVLAWEGYYDEGPVDFRSETLQVLSAVGNAVPADTELGYHLCYGSPLDEHLVQPKDMSVLVALANAMAAQVARDIQFIHMPVPKARNDDAYFEPLQHLALAPDTELYLGLIHHGDAAGDSERLAAARKYARVDGVGAECGMGRSNPGHLDAILKAHRDLLGGAA